MKKKKRLKSERKTGSDYKQSGRNGNLRKGEEWEEKSRKRWRKRGESNKGRRRGLERERERERE